MVAKSTAEIESKSEASVGASNDNLSAMSMKINQNASLSQAFNHLTSMTKLIRVKIGKDQYQIQRVIIDKAKYEKELNAIANLLAVE